ncbi:zinc ribbon domain-containing protein [Prevotella sp. E2-28]|uniref:zinc ribbon domain-containing protein n=1 Tax=Prevotella sp. E2-28 TaxID=2913620 RepID=UPI001EDC55E3|nr:zinc ribbon domain-containing protein [Prevotella sp. E2-28]UKK54904.1 zinc ribbon domain-containing protein [Prevotella sp. E2-28]
MNKAYIFIVGIVSLLLTSCYYQTPETSDAWIVTEEQMDSISFYTTHHYTQNYNFLVTADSLNLIVQQPSELLSDMLVDTIVVHHDDRLVVADIMTLPSDTIDSVWVQVARDQLTIGWIREQAMLPGVAPDNPISQFITFFSDTHLLIMLAFLVVVFAAYTIRMLYRHKARIVHFNDIPSAYPMLLVLLVSSSAVFYSTIQLADPDSWRHYYYHPTLNPFAVPLHLCLFLLSVWAMLLIALAAFDDIRRQLSFSEAILYCFGLVGVCAIDYVVFSISTLYYIGYPLLIAYIAFAVYQYVHKGRALYVCGNCGEKMHSKGICPRCGTKNV